MELAVLRIEWHVETLEKQYTKLQRCENIIYNVGVENRSGHEHCSFQWKSSITVSTALTWHMIRFSATALIEQLLFKLG